MWFYVCKYSTNVIFLMEEIKVNKTKQKCVV